MRPAAARQGRGVPCAPAAARRVAFGSPPNGRRPRAHRTNAIGDPPTSAARRRPRPQFPPHPQRNPLRMTGRCLSLPPRPNPQRGPPRTPRCSRHRCSRQSSAWGSGCAHAAQRGIVSRNSMPRNILSYPILSCRGRQVHQTPVQSAAPIGSTPPPTPDRRPRRPRRAPPRARNNTRSERCAPPGPQRSHCSMPWVPPSFPPRCKRSD
jgi:hypothetical protein